MLESQRIQKKINQTTARLNALVAKENEGETLSKDEGSERRELTSSYPTLVEQRDASEVIEAAEAGEITQGAVTPEKREFQRLVDGSQISTIFAHGHGGTSPRWRAAGVAATLRTR